MPPRTGNIEEKGRKTSYGCIPYRVMYNFDLIRKHIKK
jgi:hypothetical protein